MNFDSDGYEIFRSVLSENDIENLRSECTNLEARFISGCVRDPLSQSDLLKDFAREIGDRFAKGLGCVRSLLFDKTPESNWPVAWHRDLTIAVSEKVETKSYTCWSVKDGIDHVQPPREILEAMITVRVHLDKTDERNGALWVVPGSHRSLVEKAEVLSGQAQICECEPGDVLVMSPLILHSSKRSLEPSHRRVLHFEFARREMLAPELNWKF